MYGKGLLNDIVTEMLQARACPKPLRRVTSTTWAVLSRHLIFSVPVDFDVSDLKDYEFKFDIGIAPDFEVKGAGRNHL